MERLLVERVVACWLQVQDADARSAQGQKGCTFAQAEYWQRRMDRVSVDELHEMMAANEIGKVIDVRSPMSQAMTGRIPGAITVDPKNLRVDLLAI